VIKSRLVVLKRAGPRSTPKHLRYLERDGVTREGERGQAYGPSSETVDTHEFEARGRGDRHQFRFIVSPEDATELGELKAFTRDLMDQMERDLGTKLDWVAVDHWDTEHPHTHVVLRGVDDTGGNLLIASEYLTGGMQARAREIATEWLGPRSELEIRQGLTREVTQERWTSLDAAIAQRLDGYRIDLGSDQGGVLDPLRRQLIAGRLGHLARMGLANKISAHLWTVEATLEPTLRVLGERGDIIRTMQRALGQERRDMVTFDPQHSATVVGRILSRGLTDEMTDRSYVIVDGVDGRAHYARLASGKDISEVPKGGIVELRGVTGFRRVDRSIVALSQNGFYDANAALERLGRDAATKAAAPVLVASQVRRLEALRRAGIVERLSDGHWVVPQDLPARGLDYDRRRSDGAQIIVRSYVPLDHQVTALGATWLDESLVASSRSPSRRGFGAAVQSAMENRERFLVEQGLAEKQGQRVVLVRNLLARLRTRELQAAAGAIEADTGLVYRAAAEGQRVAGTYRRSLTLTSGKFAILDDGIGFTLVPWRPVIEPRLGQSVAAIVRGLGASWDISRGQSR
jgi:type IV secretory pathway VirD2 relaxase